MYKCGACGREFVAFQVAGQCPHCKRSSNVRCRGCSHFAHADVFIQNNNRCPKCGAAFPVGGVPARFQPGRFAVAAGCAVLWCVLLGAAGPGSGGLYNVIIPLFFVTLYLFARSFG